MIRQSLFLVALAVVLCACAATLPPANDPLSAEEHLRLGSIYEAKGSPALALAEYGKAINIDDTNAGARFSAGNIELADRNFIEAAKHYRKAIELKPAEAAYHNNLGWVYMETGDMTKARAQVKEALALDPAHGYVYLDTLGVIATRANAYKEAGQYFNEAAKSVPVDDTAGVDEINAHIQELFKLTNIPVKDAVIDERTDKGNR